MAPDTKKAQITTIESGSIDRIPPPKTQKIPEFQGLIVTSNYLPQRAA